MLLAFNSSGVTYYVLLNVQSSIEVAKWEAKKQWQSKVDQLKAKLQEKEKQIEALDKQVSSCALITTITVFATSGLHRHAADSISTRNRIEVGTRQSSQKRDRASHPRARHRREKHRSSELCIATKPSQDRRIKPVISLFRHVIVKLNDSMKISVTPCSALLATIISRLLNGLKTSTEQLTGCYLSRRLYEQEEENKELRHSTVLPHKKLAAEMEEKNRLLNDKLDALQKDILSSGKNCLASFLYA